MARFSKQGLLLVKEVESLRLLAYQDGGGIWTIGYGHTGSMSPIPIGITSPNVHFGLSITAEQALTLLHHDLAISINAIDNIQSNSDLPMSNNEFSALVIWAFNVGPHAAENSTLAHLYEDDSNNPNDFVPKQLVRWNKVNGEVNKGLINRRNKEIALFRTPDDPSDTTGAF